MSPASNVRFVAPTLLAAAVILPTVAGSQGLAKPQPGQALPHDLVVFQTKVGSFKLLGNDKTPAEGKVDLDFTGTLLINQISENDPKITVSGGVRRELFRHDPAQPNKGIPERVQSVYHGTGHITVEGHFITMQWFGRDLKGSWNGWGHARWVGEFDKDLKTGTYYYGENPSDVKEWGSQMHEIVLPGVPGRDYNIIPKGRSGG